MGLRPIVTFAKAQRHKHFKNGTLRGITASQIATRGIISFHPQFNRDVRFVPKADMVKLRTVIRWIRAIGDIE
jgi:hypothetical protein